MLTVPVAWWSQRSSSLTFSGEISPKNYPTACILDGDNQSDGDGINGGGNDDSAGIFRSISRYQQPPKKWEKSDVLRGELSE